MRKVIHIITNRLDPTESVILPIRRVPLALKTNLRNTVWQSAKIIKEVTHEFEKMHGLPGAVGAIDGKHIGISGKSFCKENYINKEGKFAVKAL